MAFPCGDRWSLALSHNQVQTLQDKAVKCIDLSLKKDVVYRTYKILTVNQMIELEMCKLGFHLVKNLLPKPLSKVYKQTTVIGAHAENSPI